MFLTDLAPNSSDPYALVLKRHDVDDEGQPCPVAVILSKHPSESEALNALYDHMLLLVNQGFTCFRQNPIQWAAEREDGELGEQIELTLFVQRYVPETKPVEVRFWTPMIFSLN